MGVRHYCCELAGCQVASRINWQVVLVGELFRQRLGFADRWSALKQISHQSLKRCLTSVVREGEAYQLTIQIESIVPRPSIVANFPGKLSIGRHGTVPPVSAMPLVREPVARAALLVIDA